MGNMRLFKNNSIAKAFLICLLILSLIGCMAGCNQKTDADAPLRQSEGWAEKSFRNKMADASVTEVVVSDALVLASPVEVAGNKVISGEGSITAIAKDKEGDYMFVVPSGGALTVKGSVTIDAAGVMGGVHIQKDAALTLEENAAVKNASAEAANALVEGKLQLSGGTLADAYGHNIYNKNETVISGGTVSGSGETFAGVYNAGKLTQDDGTICAAYYNVVSLEGSSYTFNKGSVADSVNNAVVIEKGASLKITGKEATITGAGARGIYLSGEAVIDDVTMKDSYDTLIKVTDTGKLTVNGGMISDAGYHGIDNAGTLLVTGGTINNSYSCGIVNTGSLEMTGGSVMNNANKGILNKLDGVAKVVGKSVYLGSNMFAIGNEDSAYFELTQATFSSSTNANIYAYGGEMYIHDITLAKSSSNNIRVVAAKVTMENVNVLGNASSGSSTMHGILLEGGSVDAKNVTITGTTGNGIRNKGGKFVGTNITLKSIGNNGISNTNQDFTGREGIVIIDGLTTEVVRYNNVLAENGTMTLTNAVLTESGTNNIKVSGGTLNLTNVQVQGNIADAATNVHGIYTTGGVIVGSNVSITNTRGAALRVAGEEAVVNMNGFTASDLNFYAVSQSAGTVNLTNAVIGKTTSNSVRIDSGAMNLKNVTIQGHYEGSATNVHGIYATGGKLVANDLAVTGTTGSGVRNNGGNISITNLNVENVGTHTLQLSNEKSVTTIVNGTLGATANNNILFTNGVLNLTDSKIMGQTEGCARDMHGILSSDGEVNMTNVTITGTTGSAIRNKGAIFTGKDITIENFGGYNALSNAANDYDLCGELNIDGLTVTNSTAASNDLVILASSCDGKVNISNAKFATNTETVTTYANVIVDAGTVVLDNVQMEVVTSNSFRVNGGNVTLKNATIPGHVEGSASNVNAFYAVGGTTHLENVTITDPTGDGLRVNRVTDEDGNEVSAPTVTAKNVTVTGAGRNSMWVSGGNVTLEDVTMSGIKSNMNNILVSSGTVKLVNVVSDKVNANNNICVNGGELIVDGVQVLGHNEGAKTNNHGVYANGGKLSGEGLDIQNTAGTGIRVDNDAVVDVKDVVIDTAGQHGIRLGDVNEEASNNLKVTIDGLTVSNTTTNNVLHENGELTIKNAILNEAKSNNIKLIGGKLTLNNVQVLGHVAGAKSDVHGIFVENYEGSSIEMSAADVLVANTSGQALRNKGGVVTVDGMVLNNIGAETLISNVTQNSIPGELTISRLGISEGCEHALYAVHNQDGKSTLSVSDSVLLLSSKATGIYAQYGKVTVENTIISGAAIAVHNKAELTVNGGSLHNNGWSVRNEEGAKATLTGGYYYGNVEGTLPSDIYNGGELTIDDITVGYNKKGNGKPGVIYQAATATPIVMKGNSLGVHDSSKKLKLAAEEWVQKWGTDKNIIVNCDSVADALEAERYFDPGIAEPELYVSAVGSNLELTTFPGGNFIVQIGNEKFASWTEALAYVTANDSFNAAEDGFTKAATIQIIDSYLHFENVVIPEGYNITVVDDGNDIHTVAYDSRLTGDMFAVEKGGRLNLKVTGNTNPASGLTFSGSKGTDAAVFCVNGGVITLESDLNITNAYYGIRLVDGEFNAAGKTINTAGTYGVNAVGGKLYDATLNGSSSAAIYVGATETGSELSNITINGYVDGIRSTDGKLTVDGLTVNDPATAGIYLTGNGGKVTINDLKVVDTDKTDDVTFAHGIKIEKGEISVNGGTFDKSNARNIRTYAGAVVNLTGDVAIAGSNTNDAIYVENATLNVNSGKLTISDAAGHGIYANGANAQVNISCDISIGNVNYAICTQNGGSVTAADDTKITVSGASYGLVSYTNSVISLDEVDISGVTNNSIYVDGNYDTDAARTGVSIKSGTIGTTEHAFNIYVFEDGKLSLSNATVTHTSTAEWPHGENDKINTPVHVMGNSKVTLDNVTLNGGKYGIRVHTSDYVTLNNVTIKDSTAFGIWLQASPLVTVTGELKISDTGSNGIQVNSGTLDASNATEVEITDPGKHGIETGGTAKFRNLTVSGAADHGIYVNGKVVLTGTASVTNSTNDGIYVAAGKELDASTVTSMLVDTTANNCNGISNYGTFTAQNLTVQNTAGSGIQNYSGANMTITNLTTSGMKKWHGLKNMGTVTINGATIGKSPSNNLVAEEGTMNLNGIITINGTNSNNTLQIKNSSVVNLNGNLNISGAAANGIAMESSSSLFVKGNSVVNISNTTGDGLSANTTGALTMETGSALNISDVGGRGLYVTGGINATIYNATISNTTSYALQLGKGTIIGNTITVNNGKYAEGAIGVGANADAALTNVKVYGSDANLDYQQWGGKVTLIDSAFTGKFYIYNGSELNLDGVTIDTTATDKDSTVTDSKVHGIELTGAGTKVNIIGNLTIKNANYAILNQGGGSVAAADGTKVAISNSNYGLVCWDNAVTGLDELEITNTANDAVYSDGVVKTDGTDTTQTGVTVDKLTVNTANRGINVFDSGIVTITGSASITDCKTRGIAVGANGKLDASAATSVVLTDCGYYDHDNNGESNNQGMSVEGVATINNLTMQAVNKNVNYHSIKLNNANAVLTLTGTTSIGNSVSNNVSVAAGTLNLNGAVTIGNNTSNYGIAIESGATAVNITGSLTVGGTSGGIVHRGGVLNLKDATLACTTANKHCVRVEKIEATVNVSGKVVAEIYFSADNALNVVEPLTEGSSITLSWADSVRPADYVAANFTKTVTEGETTTTQPDADSMNACETGGYLIAPESGNYTLRYMTLSDGRTVAKLVPKLVKSESDLDVLIELAKLDGETEPTFTVGASFSVSKQIDLSGFTSVTIQDDGNTETGSTITYNDDATGSFFLGDSVTTLSLTDITLDCSDKVNLQVAEGDTLNLTDVTVLQGNNRAIDAQGNVHIAGAVKVNDTTTGGERYAIVMRDSAQLTSAAGSSISIDGGQYGLVVWNDAVCTVESLTTTGLTHGGIFANANSTLTVKGGSVSGASTGNNVYIQDAATVEISNMTISDAKTYNLYIKQSEGSTATFHNVDFTSAGTYNVHILGKGTATFNDVDFTNTKSWNFVVEEDWPTVIVNGGKITGSAANKDAVYLAVGKVTFNGTEISGGARDNVYCLGSGEYTFNNAKISGGARNNVRCEGTGTYTFNNATIGTSGSNNVVLEKGTPTVNMTDVTIQGITGTATMHDLFLKAGTVNLYGKTEMYGAPASGIRIKGANSAVNMIDTPEKEATLYIHDCGDDGINIDGGSFTGHNVTIEATDSDNVTDGTDWLGSYGIQQAGGKVTLSGLVKTTVVSVGKTLNITGTLDEGSEVAIDWAKEVKVNDTFDHTEVAIPASGIGVQFDSAAAMNANKDYFTVVGYAAEKYAAYYYDKAMYLNDRANLSLTVTNYQELLDALTYIETNATEPVKAAITVAGNIDAEASINVPAGWDLTLKADAAANNRTISAADSMTDTTMFTLGEGTTLTLTDVTVDGNSKANVQVPTGTTLNLNDVTVQEANGHGIVVNGTLNLSGEVTVDDPVYYGMYVSGGTVSAKDASVTLTSATFGVVVDSGSTVNIGTLTTTDVSGSGIHITGSTASTVTVGTANLTASSDHGIHLAGSSTLNLTNATVTYTGTSSKYAVNVINTAKLYVTEKLTIVSNDSHGLVMFNTTHAEIANLDSSAKLNSIYDNGATVIVDEAKLISTGSHVVHVEGGANVTLTDATLTGPASGTYHGINQKEGTVTINGSFTADVSGHDVYVMDDAANVVNAAGQIDADIYFAGANTLTVNGALTTGSDVTVDWASGKEPATAISFNDADTLTASKDYITLGSTQKGAGKYLTYGDTTATLAEGTTVTDTDDLQTKINEADPGDVLILQGDSYKISTSLTIGGKELTLLSAGDNTSITADSGVSPFTLASGDNLTLEQITVGGAEDKLAEQIVVPANATLNLKDSTLQYMKGAVNVQTNGVLNAVGCTFSNNSGQSYGSAVGNWGGTSNITDCVFDGNSASDAGGAILNYQGGTLTVENSTFTNNSATNDGGAIAAWNSGSNQATTTITGCVFGDREDDTKGNTAKNGGALHFKSSACVNTIEDCKFYCNSASNVGGAIYAAVSVTINDTVGACEFYKNSSNEGGAIYTTSNLSVTGAKFVENTAKTARAGAVMVMNTPTVTFTNCEFTGNTAATDGGAFGKGGNDGGNVTFTDCSFAKNTASASGDDRGGGALKLQSSPTVTISGCTFTENTTAAQGGAIRLNSGSLTVSSSTFSKNEGVSGGAVVSWGTLTVTGCSFSENTASSGNGGAIRQASRSVVKITDTTFEKNTCNVAKSATTGGGAIMLQGGPTATITGGAFKANTTTSYGGAIQLNSGTLSVNGTTFEINHADGDGGAICARTATTLTGAIFSGNTADGNGDAVHGHGTVTATSCTFNDLVTPGEGQTTGNVTVQ